MGRFIVKLAHPKTGIPLYMEWSTIVDAPVTDFLELSEFKEYYMKEYGIREFHHYLGDRLHRADKTGTSSFMPLTVEDLIKNSNTIKSLPDLIRKHCKELI